MPTPTYDANSRSAGGRRTVSPPSTHKRAVIRSDRVHYPGVDSALLGSEGYEQRRQDGRRLRPARDTGLSIDRRRGRAHRRARAQRRNLMLMSLLIVMATLGLGLGWRWVSDLQAASRPMPDGASASLMAVSTAAKPSPTPLFATYKQMKLLLPVTEADLTELGFHQASFSYALRMKTPLPDADAAAAKDNKGTGRDVSESGSGDVLSGSVLRMWRDRPGKPDTAADIGAVAGAKVFSPVTGTVVLVKKYDLYGKYPDVQVHIQPEGFEDVDCVLIHIAEPTVKAGDKVIAGVTSMGVVRRLSDRINHQLGDYTADDPGDHVHLQLNDVDDPAYEGLDGATAVSGS